nr:hypothetical protein [Tanacetum cinerariifolium]
MENEHLDTILETESDEFIKSSVENLVSILSESEDFFDIESECDMPDCDDSQTTNFSTFSNPLFDDSTSSDDESSHEEVIHEISFKTYSNPLFDLDEEIISRDNLFLERLLHDDPIPLSDTLDFSYDVRDFLPFFTYPVTSSILLSSGSEDTIFDPGIAINRFYSFKPGLSHRCGTFKKFNTHRSHLNESPLEIILGNVKTLAKGFCTQSSFPQLQLGIILLHLAGSQPMLKSSYKAETSVIISIPLLVGGVADVVVEIKDT